MLSPPELLANELHQSLQCLDHLGCCCAQSSSLMRSPDANEFHTTVPTTYRAIATCHTWDQLPFCRM